MGAFLLPALIEMYRFAGEERYLACAERAFAFYDERDLRVFQCTAGALDTDCVDKETVGPLVWAAVELSDLTGNEYYRDAALRGAYYFCSFLYGYRVPCPADSDFAIYGFSSCGATAVSVQHHHLDAWGVAMVPAFERLAQWTGDLRWHLRAKSMWDCYTACVAGEDDAYVHGRRRPAGSQNEGWMHCRWNSRQDDPRPGGMNDWLVAWPGAFRLMTLDTMGF